MMRFKNLEQLSRVPTKNDQYTIPISIPIPKVYVESSDLMDIIVVDRFTSKDMARYAMCK